MMPKFPDVNRVNFWVASDSPQPRDLKVYGPDGKQLPGVVSVEYRVGIDCFGEATIVVNRVALGHPPTSEDAEG